MKPEGEKAKARSQRDAGIEKNVAEAVYPLDIVGDGAILKCTLATKGAWFLSLLHMWRDKMDRVTGDYAGLGRMWGCSEGEAGRVTEELRQYKVCAVRIRNGNVTLISRRLARRREQRIATQKRVAEHRKRASNGDVTGCNGDVTCKKGLPSSSSSSLKELNPPKAPPLQEGAGRRKIRRERKRQDGNGQWDDETFATVVLCAPDAWRLEIRKRAKALRSYAPRRALGHLLDVARENPAEVQQACEMIFGRLKLKRPPSDKAYDAAVQILKR